MTLGYSGIIRTDSRIVTSTHFGKINTIFFAKLLGFEPTPAGHSLVFSLMLCPLSYCLLGVNYCLINQFVPEFNLVKNSEVILCTITKNFTVTTNTISSHLRLHEVLPCKLPHITFHDK